MSKRIYSVASLGIIGITAAATAASGDWTLAQPQPFSIRTMTASVAGTGGTDAVAGTYNVFHWGYYDVTMLRYVTAGEVAVVAVAAGHSRNWGGTITGGPWVPSTFVYGLPAPPYHIAEIHGGNSTQFHIVVP